MQGVAVRSISEARLFTLTVRLLVGASVVSLIGFVLVMRFSWESFSVDYGVVVTVSTETPALLQRLTTVMLDLSYRQVATALVVSSGLAAVAVATLHRHPSREAVRRLRWEVLIAVALTLVAVVLFGLANLYVLTSPAPVSDQQFGPPSPLHVTAGNLTTLTASLLIVVVTILWWLRLGSVPDDAANEVEADDADSDTGDTGDSETEGVRETSVEQEAGVAPPVPARTSRDASDNLGHGAAMGYPQDWSPEDFLPPR